MADKYIRVEKPKVNEEPIKENEIRITTQGRMRIYINYATSIFNEKGGNTVVLKAMGRAINKTVTIAEIMKRTVPGLHQITHIDSTDITDVYEPIEEGLDKIETTRHVSSITITLSTAPLDVKHPGYQPPIPQDQMKPISTRAFASNRGRGRGRGRGGRGRGRGGLGRGRGRGFGRGRGRGRGTRGRGGFTDSYDQTSASQIEEVVSAVEVPANTQNPTDDTSAPRGRGRGRGGFRGGRGGRGRGGFRGGRGGRGRGSSRGRGRGRGGYQPQDTQAQPVQQ